MYNGLLLIPFMLCPLVCSALALVAWNLHLMAYPQVLIMTTMPVAVSYTHLGRWEDGKAAGSSGALPAADGRGYTEGRDFLLQDTGQLRCV